MGRIEKTNHNRNHPHIDKMSYRATRSLVLSAVTAGATGFAHAQYAPPPPSAPFSGFFNEYLRKNDPYMNQWDFGGNARLRSEVKEGFGVQGVTGPVPSIDFRKAPANASDEYFMERIRYHAGYTDKWFSAYVEGRSSLEQSDERFAYANNPAVPGTSKTKGGGPEADVIDLQQAYVTIGNQKKFPVSLKVGRQEMVYGEERLVGVSAWNNIARVFDAVKLRWQNEWFSADFFTSRPVIPEDGRFNVENDYDWFSGMYATTTKIPKHLLDVYFFSRNSSQQAMNAEPRPQFPQPSARDIYTIGGRFKSQPGQLGSWDYSLEGAYQFGDFRDRRLGVTSPRLTQDAFMVVLQGGYTFTNAWAKPRLGAEYSYSSGDDNPHDGTHGTFDNLFPSNHKFYGYMDLFSLQNIQDVRGIFQLKPASRVSVAFEGHGFWLANTHDSFYNVSGAPRGAGLTSGGGSNYGINPGYSAFVGTELDVIVGVAVARYAQLEVGYGHFFAGDYIRQSLSVAGSRDADYIYTQATINF
jgi:hypothetical protein